MNIAPLVAKFALAKGFLLRKKHEVLLICILALVLLSSIGYIGNKISNENRRRLLQIRRTTCMSNPQTYWIEEISECRMDSSRKPEEVITPDLQDKNIDQKAIDNSRNAIYRISSDGKRLLVTNPSIELFPSYPPKIVKWKDTLIFEDNTSHDIVMHDLKSGENEILFPLSVAEDYTKSEFKKSGAGFEKLSIENDDTLFVTYGGYLRDGFTVAVNLNTKKYTKVFDYAGELEKHGNVYFIVSGNGDACWGVSRYTPINMDTFKPNETSFSVDSGCYDGEYLVTIDDKNENFITITYKDKNPEGNGMVNKYFSIYKTPFSDLKSKQVLISYADMPKERSRFFYDEKSGNLYLGTESEIYVVNISEGGIKKVGNINLDVEDTQIYDFTSILDGNICLGLSNNNGGDYISDVYKFVDSQSAKTLDNESLECRDDHKKKIESKIKNDDVSEYIKQLNLPPNYVYVE